MIVEPKVLVVVWTMASLYCIWYGIREGIPKEDLHTDLISEILVPCLGSPCSGCSCKWVVVLVAI